ncbi:hypothetical protein XELAEV_18011877mg [Xenopus laevis]|uniref:Ubiquitin-like protease family profile domain-containing protein n=1 Tax=Xenopus laevis TaxID=8355 RepID=A0A974DLP1_XENLA|nr:hypothetical protein XELAEV_18011877mg [Xenopus laevis]
MKLEIFTRKRKRENTTSCNILNNSNELSETTTEKAVEQPLKNDNAVTESNSKRQRTDSDCSTESVAPIEKQAAPVKDITQAVVECSTTPFSDEEKQKSTKPCIPVNSNESANDIPPSVQESFWIPELNLRMRHKAMLQTDTAALSTIVLDAAQKLLKEQFKAEGLQPCMTPLSNLHCVSGPAVQIHADTETDHCYTSCYRKHRVEIADSDPFCISGSVCQQIERIYQNVVPDPLRSVAYLIVDRQRPDSSDCVLYAVAFAYELLSNGNVHCRFDGEKMREHLLNCLENRRITAFPKM